MRRLEATMQRLLAFVLSLALAVVAFAGGVQGQDATVGEKIELSDRNCPAGEDRFCIHPAAIEVEEGSKLVLRIENIGRVQHNVTPANGTPSVVAEHIQVEALEPKETVNVTIPWEALSQAREEMEGQNVTLECGFEGHAALGERLTIVIGAEGAQNPQPSLGVVATVGLIALAAAAWRRRA